MAYIDDIIRVATLDIPWEELNGCNILVTGATGLIGSCLIDVLMAHPDKDYTVYACGRNERRMKRLFARYANEQHFSCFLQDVSKPLSSNTDFHYIIHAASGAAPSEFSIHPVEVMKSNLLGVINMMEYGREHHLKRFLYLSSGEVYGEGDGRVFTEDYSGYVDTMSTRSCYPSSKRAAETFCACYMSEYGINSVVARPCHIYGPNFTESDNRAFAQFIRNVINDEDIVLKSDGAQYRSWCYVVDCVSALLYILLYGKEGHAYNIADDNSVLSIRQLAEIIAGIGKKQVVFTNPSDEEKRGFNIVKQSVYDTMKIRSLGWKVESDIRSKMKSTIDYKLQVV